jgi:hypothetical protein
MAFTQIQYNKLCDAISAGVKTVSYADKSVTYHNLNDMMALKKAMETDLGIGKKYKRRVCFNKNLQAHQGFPYGSNQDIYVNEI